MKTKTTFKFLTLKWLEVIENLAGEVYNLLKGVYSHYAI